jgi:hypothetical protein
MNIHSIFDSKRFGRLIAHDLRLNATKYLLMLAAFTLLLYLFMDIQMRQSPGQFMMPRASLSMDGLNHYWVNTQGYQISFVVGLIGLGLLIGTSFTGLGSKVKRMSSLQLPASTFEKFLHPFLLRFVGGAILYFILYWIIAQLVRVGYVHMPFGYFRYDVVNGVKLSPDPFHYSMIFSGQGDDTPWLAIVMAFVSIAAYLFAAPLYFRKQALVKSILTFFVAFFLVVCAFVVFSYLFFPDLTSNFNVHLNEVQLTKNWSSIELAAYALTCGSWLFFLLIGFFKLKELKV